MVWCLSEFHIPPIQVKFHAESCERVYYFASSHGCPHFDILAKVEHRAFSVFAFLLAAMLLYCIAGSLFNIKYRGASGVESIPHIIFLRKMYQAAAEYLSVFFVCLRRSVEPIRSVAADYYTAVERFVLDKYYSITSTSRPTPEAGAHNDIYSPLSDASVRKTNIYISPKMKNLFVRPFSAPLAATFVVSRRY